MNLLLDTHIIVWALAETSRLNEKTQEVLADPNHRFWYSPISAVEIAIKNSTGRHNHLMSLMDFDGTCERTGLTQLPLNTDAAQALEALPMHHRDPFDRMLIAQAQSAGMRLLTVDKIMPAYGQAVFYVGT